MAEQPRRTVSLEDLRIEDVSDLYQTVMVPTDYDEEFATKILSEEEVTVIADIKMGDKEATAWGCDLTHEYVSINADYRS